VRDSHNKPPSLTPAVQRPPPAADAQPVHLLVDSTGLNLCDAGELLVERYGTTTRRSWRKLHLGVDADTSHIVTSALTRKEVDDGVEVSPVPHQRSAGVPSEMADSAPTHLDSHLQHTDEKGSMTLGKASGYSRRAKVKAPSPDGNRCSATVYIHAWTDVARPKLK
jgi:hypothetical protein